MYLRSSFEYHVNVLIDMAHEQFLFDADRAWLDDWFRRGRFSEQPNQEHSHEIFFDPDNL